MPWFRLVIHKLFFFFFFLRWRSIKLPNLFRKSSLMILVIYSSIFGSKINSLIKSSFLESINRKRGKGKFLADFFVVFLPSSPRIWTKLWPSSLFQQDIRHMHPQIHRSWKMSKVSIIFTQVMQQCSVSLLLPSTTAVTES